MEKIARKYRILKRDWRKSNPDILEESNFSRENNFSFVRLGSLERSQSSEEEEEIAVRVLRPDTSSPPDSNLEGFDDLDDATADMMAMFRNTGLDSACSSARSSVKSRYSIQFDTDSDDDEPEPDHVEEELSSNFPGYERFSMFVGQNDESRYV